MKEDTDPDGVSSELVWLSFLLDYVLCLMPFLKGNKFFFIISQYN